MVRKYKLQAQLNPYVGLKGALRISKRVHKKQKDLAKTITEFYLQDDVSRASAGKKRLNSKNRKSPEEIPTANLTDIYKKFKQETGINVSYTTFVRYKPFYIVRPNISDRDTCNCKIHSKLPAIAHRMEWCFAHVVSLARFYVHIVWLNNHE